ncbi:MAG TPA: hypothetical protein VL989_01825 [Candidatus Sulfotelmatobacter sp.]|nr:hypothetical protein [Candidatus Sulfotelmatobacter sp.]
MPKIELSSKRLAITKANSQLIVILSIASFITIFCLVASNSVYSLIKHQSDVISKSQQAKNQLQTDIVAYQQLVKSYNKFQSGSTNIIGGSTSGGGYNAGTNAQIVLDALPPKYDFPELITDINNLITTGGFQVQSLTGTDDQLSESTNSSSENPQPVAMPFTFSVNNTNYTGAQQLFTLLDRSIRPIQIDTMTIAGSDGTMSITVNAHSYYQPGKTLSITQQSVK